MILQPYGLAVFAAHLVALVCLGLLAFSGLSAARHRDRLAGFCVSAGALSEVSLVTGDAIIRILLVRVVDLDSAESILDVWELARPVGHALVAGLLAVGVTRLARAPERPDD